MGRWADKIGLHGLVLSDKVGQQLARAMRTNAAYRILGDEFETWTTGGCWILADALCQIWPDAELWAITSNWGVEHVVAKRGDLYYDADGAVTEEELKQRYNEIFSASPGSLQRGWATLVPFTEELQRASVATSNVSRREDLSDQTAAFLRTKKIGMVL